MDNNKRRISVRERLSKTLEDCKDIDILFDYGLRTLGFCPMTILLCLLGRFLLLKTHFIIAPLLCICLTEFSKILAIVYVISLPIIYPIFRGINKRRNELYKKLNDLDDSFVLSRKMTGKYMVKDKDAFMALIQEDTMPEFVLQFLDMVTSVTESISKKRVKKSKNVKSIYQEEDAVVPKEDVVVPEEDEVVPEEADEEEEGILVDEEKEDMDPTLEFLKIYNEIRKTDKIPSDREATEDDNFPLVKETAKVKVKVMKKKK